MGNSQASSLAKLIRNSRSILYYDFRWNDIGPEGGKAILNALQNNNEVQELNLMGNRVPNEILNSISDKLQSNKTNAHKSFGTRSEERKPTRTFLPDRSYNRGVDDDQYYSNVIIKS